MKSLAEDPGDRFETAEKLAEVLDYFDSKNKVAGVTKPDEQKTEIFDKTKQEIPKVRKVNWAAIIGASALVLIIILILSIPNWRKSVTGLFLSDSIKASELAEIFRGGFFSHH